MHLIVEVEIVTITMGSSFIFENCILKIFLLKIKIILTFQKNLILSKFSSYITFTEKDGSPCCKKCWTPCLGVLSKCS